MGVHYESVIERMRWAGKLKNDSAVARVLDITPQALSNYKKRGEMPSDLMLKFSNIFGLSVDWMISGEGEVYRPDKSDGLRAAEESSRYMTGRKQIDLKTMSPEEMIYVGKLLKVLRSSDKINSNAVKCTIDSFLMATEAPMPLTGTGK